MSAVVETWLVTRRRQLFALRSAELIAVLAAGILIGRAYSFAFPPPDAPQWWSAQIQTGGAIQGPITLLGSDGRKLLKLEAGVSIIREGKDLKVTGGNFEIRDYLIRSQEDAASSPPIKPVRGVNMSKRLHNALARCRQPHCMNELTWENHRHGQLACDACMQEKTKDIIREIAAKLSPGDRAHIESRLAKAFPPADQTRQGEPDHG